MRKSQTEFQSGWTILHSTSSKKRSSRATFSPSCGGDNVVNVGLCIRYAVVPLTVICISLITYGTGTSFHRFIWHLYVFCDEVSLKAFGPFFQLGCLFCYCWVVRVLCIFWVTVLYKMRIFQKCSPSQGLSAHALNSLQLDLGSSTVVLAKELIPGAPYSVIFRDTIFLLYLLFLY